MYTPERIESLKPDEIFVYGSNQYARHGAGAAVIARQKFGAIYGDCPMGLCGQSYGIITQSFSPLHISIEFIYFQVQALYYFALLRQDLTFFVTKVGCGLAGFSTEEIKECFLKQPFKPKNIILPIEFSKAESKNSFE